MKGDGAGCLRCVTGCNGNFCTSSFVFTLERSSEKSEKTEKSPSSPCCSGWKVKAHAWF